MIRCLRTRLESMFIPPFLQGYEWKQKQENWCRERECEREWLKELNIEREKFDVVKSLVKKYDYYYESINIFQHKIPSSTHTRMTGRQAARECDEEEWEDDIRMQIKTKREIILKYSRRKFTRLERGERKKEKKKYCRSTSDSQHFWKFNFHINLLGVTRWVKSWLRAFFFSFGFKGGMEGEKSLDEQQQNTKKKAELNLVVCREWGRRRLNLENIVDIDSSPLTRVHTVVFFYFTFMIFVSLVTYIRFLLCLHLTHMRARVTCWMDMKRFIYLRHWGSKISSRERRKKSVNNTNDSHKKRSEVEHVDVFW